ncbi:winged helix-turn-helix domain-containing protein [Aeromonas jandaei]|uniref:winged helix-turn-helix domain-containing protein n=1 Tax=Aeromonas jandaei TaxID=650 RepID=UPI003EC68D7B
MEKIIFDKFSCTLSLGDNKKKIGSKDALVLECLFIAGPDGATKNDILAFAWNGVVVTDASLSKSISSLRAVLSELSSDDDIIITIPRVGYKVNQEKLFLHNPTESQQYIIDKHEPKNPVQDITEVTPIKKEFKAPRWVNISTKIALSIASLTLICIYTIKFFTAEEYIKKDYISPSIIKESLDENKQILFFNADDKDYFREKISKIKCNCIFLASDNEQYHFIAAYLTNVGKSVGFAFKKSEKLDIVNFIQTQIDNGAHHD